jgi:hypothetical protein
MLCIEGGVSGVAIRIVVSSARAAETIVVKVKAPRNSRLVRPIIMFRPLQISVDMHAADRGFAARDFAPATLPSRGALAVDTKLLYHRYASSIKSPGQTEGKIKV